MVKKIRKKSERSIGPRTCKKCKVSASFSVGRNLDPQSHGWL